MSKEEKIVPITSGRGKPDCASFALIVGRTDKYGNNLGPASRNGVPWLQIHPERSMRAE